ncbi:hypothetical protein ACHAWC_005218, partial [Mediolabrus comicus]
IVDQGDDTENNAKTNVTGADDHTDDSKTSADSESSVNQEKTGRGGIIGSVVSWFRGGPTAVTSTADSSNKKRDNADKIPHGPDGRGGGGAVISSSSMNVDEESIKSDDHQDSDFIITTDLSIEGDGVPTETSKSKRAKKNAMKSGDKATAFVVPHHPKPHVDTEQYREGHDDNLSKGKASKAKDVELDPSSESSSTHEVLNKTSLSQTASLNETEAIKSTNFTSTNHNATYADLQMNESAIIDEQSSTIESRQDYVSSGYWVPIDILSSFGLSTLNDDLKVSRLLRPARKAVAKATGLHGFVSGKIYTTTNSSHAVITRRKNVVVISIDEELGIHDAGAMEAEMLARRVARQRRRRNQRIKNARANRAGRRWGFRRRGQQQEELAGRENSSDYVVLPSIDSSPDALEQRRRKRVEEIDHLLQRGSIRLLELQCERDDLLQAPNPLFNYTKKYDASTNQTFGDVRTT